MKCLYSHTLTEELFFVYQHTRNLSQLCFNSVSSKYLIIDNIMQQNIVFVGAGGTGVSSLVLLFHTLGMNNIIAIDSTAGELTKKLEKAGIRVIIGHNQYTVQDQDIIIYSDAADKSPEVLAAHKKTLKNPRKVLPPLSLFQFLGEISKYMQTISVAGTHGKSTTTALTATTLAKHHSQFGLGIVGAPVKQRWHHNFIINDKYKWDIKAIIEYILFPKSPTISHIIKKYLFVVEADEYNHHFLHLDSDYSIITNIELDHADVYHTFKNYLQTFEKFAHKVRQNIFILASSPGIAQFLSSKAWNLESIIWVDEMSFNFTYLLGTHNHINASLAFACSQYLIQKYHHSKDITALWTQWMGNNKSYPESPHDIIETISNFQGLRRRGELLWYNTYHIPIITDYGHHPTELKSTLQALHKKYPQQKITCIFQPHQARRVMEFRKPFTDTLQTCDNLIIYDIYAARENFWDLKGQFPTTHQTSSNITSNKNNINSQNTSPEKTQTPTQIDFSSLNSFDDLGELFAQSSWWMYTTNFYDIQNTLDNTTEGVIIIFTAGNLDWEVRQYLWIQKDT